MSVLRRFTLIKCRLDVVRFAKWNSKGRRALRFAARKKTFARIFERVGLQIRGCGQVAFGKLPGGVHSDQEGVQVSRRVLDRPQGLLRSHGRRTLRTSRKRYSIPGKVVGGSLLELESILSVVLLTSFVVFTKSKLLYFGGNNWSTITQWVLEKVPINLAQLSIYHITIWWWVLRKNSWSFHSCFKVIVQSKQSTTKFTSWTIERFSSVVMKMFKNMNLFPSYVLLFAN